MNLSVVIPAHNESKNISNTIIELFDISRKLRNITKLQVIVVDDHSSDDTYQVVNKLNDARIICLRLSRRSGSHTALRVGSREASGRVVLCISADGQDDPSCLKLMLEKWEDGATVVWAIRQARFDEPWYIRRPAELFYKLLFWFLNREESNIDLSRADFFLLDRVVVDAINSCLERNTSLFGLIAWLGFKQDFIEYQRRSRLSGRSKWSFRGRFLLAKDWIIAFSGLPLKITSLLGIAMSILGVLGAIYVIFDKLFFSNVIEGWTSIIALVLIIGGIQLIILGIIGEYLWRNLDESRKRPLFFIEKRSDQL